MNHVFKLAAILIFTGLRVGEAAASGIVGTEQTSSTLMKPNVIVVLTDDLGYADISSFAETPLKVKTPNLDRMTAEGKKFTQFYVAMPICSPSRAAILSGQFAPETGLTSFLQERKGNIESDQNDYMDPEKAHLPLAFKIAGYATAHIGKWHLGGGRDVHNAPSIRRYGYDEAYSTWESPNRDPRLGKNHAPWDKNRKDPGQVERHKRTEYMVDKTLNFLQRHKDAPCFITLWPDDLHTPFRPSPEMLKKYGGDPDDDRDIRNFYGVLEEYDRQMGRLMDGLKEIGQDQNTILVFTGDNGPAPHYNHSRNDGMRGMKLSLYEGGIRQPFIIKWPGKIAAGSTDDKTVMNAVDLLPTLTRLAGISMTEVGKAAHDGEDLSAAVLGDPMERRRPMLWEYGRTNRVPRPKNKKLDYSPTLGIREGDYKLLINPDGSDAELYNVVADRKEQKNLADQPDHKERVERLSKQVIEWQKTLPHRTHPVEAPEKN